MMAVATRMMGLVLVMFLPSLAAISAQVDHNWTYMFTFENDLARISEEYVIVHEPHRVYYFKGERLPNIEELSTLKQLACQP